MFLRSLWLERQALARPPNALTSFWRLVVAGVLDIAQLSTGSLTASAKHGCDMM